MSFIFAVFVLCYSRNNIDSLVAKFKHQLENNTDIGKEEQAILWSLAELAGRIDNSVTAEEVQIEIDKKIDEILQRVEITDSILKKDFNLMKIQFATAKSSIEEMIESSKSDMVEEIQIFEEGLINSLKSLVNTSSDAMNGWVKNSFDRIRDTFSSLRYLSLKRAIIFFACFQILLAFGLIFYKKLDAQLRMFL